MSATLKQADMPSRKVVIEEPALVAAVPTWRFELVRDVDTVRTSDNLKPLADSVISHLALTLRDKVSEQRRRVNRLEPDFYTEDEFRVSEEGDLMPAVGGSAPPRIFEIIAGSGSPVIKTREVTVSEIKGAVSDRARFAYDESVEAMNKFNKQDLGEILMNHRENAISSGKGRPAAGEKMDFGVFDRAFSRQSGGDRSTRLDGLRGIELGR